jgi:hypothetical protein
LDCDVATATWSSEESGRVTFWSNFGVLPFLFGCEKGEEGDVKKAM